MARGPRTTSPVRGRKSATSGDAKKLGRRFGRFPQATEGKTVAESQIVDKYTIPFRDKEILILRTAWLSRGDYIWGRHYVWGKESGLTDEEIERITQGPGAAGWDDFDATLLRAADELHTSRFVSDATWNALSARYSEDQVREVVMIIGDYTQLAMFQNSLGAQLPEGYDGLPD